MSEIGDSSCDLRCPFAERGKQGYHFWPSTCIESLVAASQYVSMPRPSLRIYLNSIVLQRPGDSLCLIVLSFCLLCSLRGDYQSPLIQFFVTITPLFKTAPTTLIFKPTLDVVTDYFDLSLIRFGVCVHFFCTAQTKARRSSLRFASKVSHQIIPPYVRLAPARCIPSAGTSFRCYSSYHVYWQLPLKSRKTHSWFIAEPLLVLVVATGLQH